MKNQINNLLIVGLFFLSVVLGCSTPANTSQTSNSSTKSSESESKNAPDSTSEKPVSVSAKELTKTYDENELAADEKYKGKMLAVSGKISNIAETLGNLTISLEGHDVVKSVMCSFDESEKSNIAKLKKGQQVTLVGKGDGMTAGLYVGLDKCKIQ